MYANDGADYRVPSVEIKPWFCSQKSGFLVLKPKTQCVSRKKLVFFHPCIVQGNDIEMRSLTTSKPILQCEQQNLQSR